jgi:alpha-1,6-mannosyltransferase
MSHKGIEIGRATLPPPVRAGAELTVLDVTKWYGETSGGVRTYLNAKSAYVRERPALRHVLALPGGVDEIVDDEGVRTYRLRGPRIPTQRQYRFLLATRSLRRIVEHERPDVIEVGSQYLVPWVTRLATRGVRIPLVAFYHGNMERNVPVSLGLEADHARITRALTRRYMRLVDSLFVARLAASEAMATDLRAAGVRDVTRVRLGVDSATFHPGRRDSWYRVRCEHGIPTDAPVALYSGRIAAEKEIPWLVRAWNAATARRSAWLVLVGDGAPRHELIAESLAEGRRIVWLSFEDNRERLADLLACADIYVAPGPIETFGLSALEAMSCGVPLVSIERGAVAELVARSGGGLTYRWRDSASLGDAVDTLLDGTPRAVGDRGRAYAIGHHDWENALDELFAFYRNLSHARAIHG